MHSSPATLITIAWLACVQFAVGESTWSSFGTRQRYHFTVTDEDIAKTPVWREDADHPPLAARKALALAKQKLTELEGKTTQWQLRSLSLEPWHDGTHWVYLARYEQVRDPVTPGAWVTGGGYPTIRIPVLMSGIAVHPKIDVEKE